MIRPVLREPSQEHVPAYVANGVVGLRIGVNPLLGAVANANGFVGLHPQWRTETAAYIPYPLAMDIRLGPWWLSQRPQWCRFVDQAYDMASGELVTRLVFTVAGVTAEIEVLTFACRFLPTLVCQEVSVRVDAASRLELQAGLSPKAISGRPLRAENGPTAQGVLVWESSGGLSRCGLAYWTCLDGAAEASVCHEPAALAGGPVTRYRVEAKADRVYRLKQITSCVADVLHGQPDTQAIRLVWQGNDYGFDELRARNRACWVRLWERRPVIDAAESCWQDYADAAYFYLHSSVHRSSPCSTGLFGLGLWEGYHCFSGHQFWDLETFAFPPLLLTAPESARAMLDHRWRHVDAARRNAAMNGLAGLQFPWQAMPRSGEEGTPNDYPQIIHEQHVNMDIALAFAQYAWASGDEDFLRDRAWPVLRGVAEWIVSRASPTARGWEIHRAMGICENRVRDNNAYVNMAAGVILEHASAVAARLGRQACPRWSAVRNALVLDVSADGVIRRFDGAQECDADTTEVLAGLYPFGYDAPEAVEQATLRYYLERARSSVGWPMLPPLACVQAARLGDRALSRWYLEKGLGDYVFGAFHLFDEYGQEHTRDKPKVGPYLAHLGAYLMNVLVGLPALTLDGGDVRHWARRTVTLPEGWQGIEALLEIRGQAWRLRARHGVLAELTPQG